MPHSLLGQILCRSGARRAFFFVAALHLLIPVVFLLACTSDKPDPDAAWPVHVEQFPALTCDGQGRIWMALVERPETRGRIRIFTIDGEVRRDVCVLDSNQITGMASPALGPLESGCLVSFPVEIGGRWRVAYSAVDEYHKDDRELRFIAAGGTANISPAVAVSGSRAWIVWESNAGTKRGIYSCWVEGERTGPVTRLSSDLFNSYNPSVVSLENGTLFAAWDTIREGSADIYGASHKDGEWQAEMRLTHGPRVERHPHLAVKGNEIWMAWQAQSYPGRRVNYLWEQRIAVARISDEGLMSPVGLFEKISTIDHRFLRPTIAFDNDGRLWLAARHGQQLKGSGWRPAVWSYHGNAWSEIKYLTDREGRWQPIPMVFSQSGMVTASQYDDLPRMRYHRDKNMHWRSGVAIDSSSLTVEPPAQPLKTTPLAMPPTDFSVEETMALCSADLPRQTRQTELGTLNLYWGDLHDHTDLSVCNRQLNPPGHDLFANERDIEKLDFVALTDHGLNFDPQQWAYNGEQTRFNHDPGTFVTFLGQEWTSGNVPPEEKGKPDRFGHRNLIFLNPYHPEFFDAYDGPVSPTQVWEQLSGSDFICIPHQLADWKGKGKVNPPTDWDHVDEEFQPVAEIFQARQSYEYFGCPRQAPNGAPFKGFYLQDAWARGIVIGVVASPDHGGGMGKAGVWAADLTRESIFAAIKARHTFGTSGEKMALWFRAGSAIMGDKIERHEGPVSFDVSAVAEREIAELVIFRNNTIVHKIIPKSRSFSITWTDEQPPVVDRLWYYARIQAANGELAWTSPIWFISGT